MKEHLEQLAAQFVYEPEVVGGPVAVPAGKVVIGGMGGSHLAADLLAAADSTLPLLVHSDYGLPELTAEERSRALFVAVSHSGNTEETLDFARQAHEAGLPLAVIAGGGELIAFAKEQQVPHVVLPQSGVPPRMSTGYHLVALLTVLGLQEARAEVVAAAQALPWEDVEKQSRDLAAYLAGGMPLLYSSTKNRGLAAYLKTELNETPKIPAFVHTFPELNHNEMTGVLTHGVEAFRFLLLQDSADHPQVQKRMEVFAALVEERGGTVRPLELPSKPYQKILHLFVLAQQCAFYMAEERGTDPLDTTLIEEFKKRI